MKKQRHYMLLFVWVMLVMILGMKQKAQAQTFTSGDYQYSENTDGTITLTKYTGDETAVTVPAQLDGKTVYSVAAFSENRTIEEVTISSGISKIGKNCFKYCSGLKTVHLPEGLLEIESSGFNNCISLEELQLPTGLQTIGENAFQMCRSLKELAIPEGVTTLNKIFDNCRALEKVTLSKTVSTVIAGAFSGCSALLSIEVDSDNMDLCSVSGVLFDHSKKVLLAYPWGKNAVIYQVPDGTERIGEQVFGGYTCLQTIVVPASVTEISHNSFLGAAVTEIRVDEENGFFSAQDGVLFDKEMHTLLCYPCGRRDGQYVVPETVTRIEEYAFYHNKYVNDVQIQKNVAAIGMFAFAGCTGLKTVTIAEGLEQIEAAAFNDCRMENMILPDSVKTVGVGAFRRCIKLKYITLSNQLTCIDAGTFGDCTALSSIVIPNQVTRIGERAFSSCTGLQSVTLSENLELINMGVFSGCTALTSIEVPDGVTGIGKSAFASCSSLRSVKLPGCLGQIRESTFSGCKSLTSIEVPDQVTKIEKSAFASCQNLVTVSLPDSLTQMGIDVFSDCNAALKIHAPEASVGAQYAVANSIGYVCSNPEDEGYKYRELEDGTLEITGYVRQTENLVILNHIQDKAVTQIGMEAFYSHTELESVVIPEGVVSIGVAAFVNCSALTSVTFPESLTTISGDLFDGGGYTHNTELVITASENSCGGTYAREHHLALAGSGEDSSQEEATVETANGEQTGRQPTNDTSGNGEPTSEEQTSEAPEHSGTAGEEQTGGQPTNEASGNGESTSEEQTSEAPEHSGTTGEEQTGEASGNGGSTSEGQTSEAPGSGSFTSEEQIGKVPADEKPTEGNTGTKTTEQNISQEMSDAVISSATTETGKEVDPAKEASAFAAFRYQLNPDGTAVLSDYTGDDTEVRVPAEIDGHKIVSVQSFSGNQRVERVTIDRGVSEIGAGCFSNCEHLQEIVLPDKLVSIGEKAFENCKSLTKIELPDSVAQIGISAFEACSSLKTVQLPAAITIIEYKVFYQCGSLVEIVIPEGVTAIGEGAFSDCTELRKVTIPDTVTSIDKNAFSDEGAEQNPQLVIVAPEKSYGEQYAHNAGILVRSGKEETGQQGTETQQGKTDAEAACQSDTEEQPGKTEEKSHQPDTELQTGEPVEEEKETSGQPDTELQTGEPVEEEKETSGQPDTELQTGEPVEEEKETSGQPDTELQTGEPVQPDTEAQTTETVQTNTQIHPVMTIKPDEEKKVQITAGRTTETVRNVSTQTVLRDSGQTQESKTGPKEIRTGTKLEVEGLCYVVTSLDYRTAECAGTTDKKLSSLKIPDEICQGTEKFRVTGISEGAFKNHKHLTRVEFGKHLASVGKAAFYGCRKLKLVLILGDALTTVENGAFKKTSKDLEIYSKRDQYKKMVSVSNKGTVFLAGSGIYQVCRSGKREVSFVGAAASSISTIKVPASINAGGKTYKVTQVSKGAFQNQKKLKKIIIGKNITQIGENAFSGCAKLNYLKIHSKKIKKIGASRLSKKLKVAVPKDKTADYQVLLKNLKM